MQLKVNMPSFFGTKKLPSLGTFSKKIKNLNKEKTSTTVFKINKKRGRKKKNII